MSRNVSRRLVALSLVTGGIALSACAGENLFSLAGTVGQGGPEVDITSPGEGFTTAVGDSILVVAEVNAPNGGGTVVYRGTYTSGTAAYVQETGSMNGVAVATLSNYLRAADGQVAGSAYVVVEVTGQGGQVGKDSVKVTIN